MAITVPFDDGLGECIVQDHPRLRGLPYIVVWTRAESRLGDALACSENRLGKAGDELAERLPDECENIRCGRAEELLAMHGVQRLSQ